MNDQEQIQPFINNLLYIVQSEKFPEIKWSTTGNEISIDRKNFTDKILPKISKSKDYSAFIRQLYVYGFTKFKISFHKSTIDFYTHVYFKRDDLSKLHLIKRISNNNNNKNQIELKKNERTDVNVLFEFNKKLIFLEEKVEKQGKVINKLIEVISSFYTNGGNKNENTNKNPNNNKKMLMGDNFLFSELEEEDDNRFTLFEEKSEDFFS